MRDDIGSLRDRIELHDLAERLGLDRPGGRGGLYRSPAHADSSPSLSVYDKGQGQRWRDHSTDRGGDAIDLIEYVLHLDTGEALRWLRQTYGIPTPQRDAPQRPQTLAEAVAGRAVANAADGEGRRGVIEYLSGRSIAEEVLDRALRRRTLGWSTWCSDKVPRGQAGHGGPGVAFVVRRIDTPEVVGVDTRFVDPTITGGQKSRRLPGDGSSDPWHAGDGLKDAATVVLVESAINALSVLSCKMKKTTALAVRSIHHAPKHDWRFLRGKRVIVAYDYDQPDQHGRRAGVESAWAVQAQLTGLGIAAHLLDQGDWAHNDLNDILQAEGPEELKFALNRLDPWAIPGVRGDDKGIGRSRVWLPAHDLRVYWRYRCKEDAITWITKVQEDEHGGKREEFEDLAGFRIAQIGRIEIAAPESTLQGGEALTAGRMYVAVTQDPWNEHELQKHVAKQRQVNNIEWWSRIGPIYKPAPFLRLVSVLARASQLSTTESVNFVGLCWHKNKLKVSEAADCYFPEPERQCVYHDLRFPAGRVEDARRVIEAYRRTFGRSAALLLLIWSLGSHLKPILQFWPHMTLQARKGAGKSTLIARLGRTIGMRVFGSETLNSKFRMYTSINGTTQPVAWEEISTRADYEINAAVSLLQQCYTSTVIYWGSEKIPMLHSAPVLLAGEDVPVNSLTGKVIRVSLQHRGPLLDDELPVFPVRQWLEFLAGQDPKTLKQRFRAASSWAREVCLAAQEDDSARRMVENYAALALVWSLLQDFAGLPDDAELLADLVREMNAHIAETEATREPWCWIVEVILAEISAGRYHQPYTIRRIDETDCLLIRPSHMMHHIRSTSGLRDVWNSLPIKGERVFKEQLKSAGVVYQRRRGELMTDRIDARIGDKLESHMTALELDQLERYGLVIGRPTE